MTRHELPATDTTAYHLAELQLINDLNDPRRCVPSFDCNGWDVLDVGCGIGQTLVAPELLGAKSRHGIDIDSHAVEAGLVRFPELDLRVAPAEDIPFGDAQFDLVFSRVALPYTNVPRALKEMARVTRPNGLIWLALHSWRTELGEVNAAWKHRAARRLVDRTYVVTNSLLLSALGVCVARPWSGAYETFQFAGGIKRLLKKLRFFDIECQREPHFCISARKAVASR